LSPFRISRSSGESSRGFCGAITVQSLAQHREMLELHEPPKFRQLRQIASAQSQS
jgi:hypothetical protein